MSSRRRLSRRKYATKRPNRCLGCRQPAKYRITNEADGRVLKVCEGCIQSLIDQCRKNGEHEQARRLEEAIGKE